MRKKEIRTSLNPRDLNETLERKYYYSGPVNEVIAQFYGTVVFAIVNKNKKSME